MAGLGAMGVGLGVWGHREGGRVGLGFLRRRRTPSLRSPHCGLFQKAQATGVVQADVKLWGQGPSVFTPLGCEVLIEKLT